MTIHAESVNYWKTSKSSFDTWMSKIIKEIESVNGDVIQHAVVSNKLSGGILIQFALGDDTFEIKFPILPCENDTDTNRNAAKIQAVTALYHSVKDKVVYAKFMGLRVAFGHYLKLEDGRTVEDVLTSGGRVDFGLFLPSGQSTE